MKPSTERYTIVASRVFQLSVGRFRSFVEGQHSAAMAANLVSRIKTKISQELTLNPHIAPVSERLLSLGIAEYRQWLVDDHNIVMYRIDEESRCIELLLLMSTKQSIEKLLYEVNLLI